MCSITAAVCQVDTVAVWQAGPRAIGCIVCKPAWICCALFGDHLHCGIELYFLYVDKVCATGLFRALAVLLGDFLVAEVLIRGALGTNLLLAWARSRSCVGRVSIANCAEHHGFWSWVVNNIEYIKLKISDFCKK